MRNKIVPVIMCLIMLIPFEGYARTVKKVDFPESTSINGTSLKLCGIGIRKKLVISVYLGALYLEQPTKNDAQVISSDQSKMIKMHFLYKEVTSEQLIEAWNEGFQKNAPSKAAGLKSEIARFNGFFKQSAKKDDTITITYSPDKGTEVRIKNSLVGTIEGKTFMEALFSIWFGPHPPSNGLKKGMLGE